MGYKIFLSSVCVVLALSLLNTSNAQQEAEEWVWYDNKRNERTRAELDAIINKHNSLFRKDKSGIVIMEADIVVSPNGIISGERRLNLSKANLTNGELSGANLSTGDLTGAILKGVNLTGAVLWETNLTGAFLWGANLKNAVFQPDSLPLPENIAFAHSIDHLRYRINPEILVQLKQSLFDAGFRSQSKQVNTALQRVEASPIEYVLFDVTCEWGSNPWRPLLILGLSWLIFGALYGLIETKYCHPNKYLIASKQGMLTEIDTGSDEWRKPNNEWLAYGVAYLFSLQRALRIGFREISPSHWLMMLLPPDFEMKSRGWPRFVSGVQSLLSVVLIALSLFSYFGRPFEF